MLDQYSLGFCFGQNISTEFCGDLGGNLLVGEYMVKYVHDDIKLFMCIYLNRPIQTLHA